MEASTSRTHKTANICQGIISLTLYIFKQFLITLLLEKILETLIVKIVILWQSTKTEVSIVFL